MKLRRLDTFSYLTILRKYFKLLLSLFYIPLLLQWTHILNMLDYTYVHNLFSLIHRTSVASHLFVCEGIHLDESAELIVCGRIEMILISINIIKEDFNNLNCPLDITPKIDTQKLKNVTRKK
ncbi:unnamed protein product [Rotaria sp. Silwood2]|nr:unnamed protein product [Rotaria sp. Silwood2]